MAGSGPRTAREAARGCPSRSRRADSGSSRHRLPRRVDHGAVAVRAAGAADPARGRRLGKAPVRDHPRARRQLQRLHGPRRLAPRLARPARGRAAEPRDRPPARALRHAALPPTRAPRGASAALSHPAAAPHGEQRRRSRCEPRPGLRAVRGPGARRSHGSLGDGQRRARDVLRRARVRARGGAADARDRRREPPADPGHRVFPPPRRGDAACRRCGSRRHRAGDCARSRPGLHDVGSGLHGGAPGTDRTQLDSPPRARGAPSHGRAGSDRSRRAGPGCAGARGHRRVDQTAAR